MRREIDAKRHLRVADFKKAPLALDTLRERRGRSLLRRVARLRCPIVVELVGAPEHSAGNDVEIGRYHHRFVVMADRRFKYPHRTMGADPDVDLPDDLEIVLLVVLGQRCRVLDHLGVIELALGRLPLVRQAGQDGMVVQLSDDVRKVAAVPDRVEPSKFLSLAVFVLTVGVHSAVDHHHLENRGHFLNPERLLHDREPTRPAATV